MEESSYVFIVPFRGYDRARIASTVVTRAHIPPPLHSADAGGMTQMHNSRKASLGEGPRAVVQMRVP